MKRSAWSLLALIAGLIWLLASWLPARKPEAALGRFSYAELMFALVAAAVFLSTLCIATAGKQKRKRRIFQIASIWIGCLTTLACAEMVASFLPARNNPFYLYNADDSLDDKASDAKLPFTRPPHLEWEGWSRGNIAEGLPAQDRRWLTFQTDVDGFRNSADVDRADLVFVGDSFTEAGNVQEDESFVRLTAATLGLTARNLGVAGYMPPAELVVLERYGLPCNPKIVVWQIYEGNDLPESARYADWQRAGYPTRPRQGTSRWEQWSPTNMLFRSLVTKERDWFAGTFDLANGSHRLIRFGFSPSVDWIPMSPDGRLTHPGWEPLVIALDQGRRRLDELGIAMIILFLPAKITVMGEFTTFDDWSVHRLPPFLRIPEHISMDVQLENVCDRLDLVYVDSTRALRVAAADGAMVYLPSDTHLSPRGHEIVSVLIVDAIRDITNREPSED